MRLQRATRRSRWVGLYLLGILGCDEYMRFEVTIQSGGGTGSGRVTAFHEQDLDCTVTPGQTLGKCTWSRTFSMSSGGVVELTGVPESGSFLKGWSGDCVGNGPNTCQKSWPGGLPFVAIFVTPLFDLVEIQDVTVSPPTGNLLIGGALPLTANVVLAPGVTGSVSVDWSTNNPAVATVAPGLGTQVSVTGVGAGIAVITATAHYSSGSRVFTRQGTAAVAVSAGGPPNPNPTEAVETFSDDFSSANNWSSVIIDVQGNTTHSESTPTTGGNPGGYREGTISFSGLPGGIHVAHFLTGALFDPGLKGPIDSIVYSEDRRMFSPAGADMAAEFVIRQNGVIHRVGLPTFANTAWQTYRIKLLRGSFSPQPDFTSGLIELGYLRSTSISGSNPNFRINVVDGLDNWVVKVYYHH